MAQNDFKPFAIGAGANVTAQADWELLAALATGFQSGKASSAQINKAIRQASFIAAALAQYTSDKTGGDVLDDGDQAAFISKMAAAFGKDFQPLDATLTALAALTGVADKLAYFNGDDTAALTALTAVGRDIIGKSSIADVLTYLGLGDLVDALIKTNNLSDLSSIPTARTNLNVPKGVDKQMCNEWAVFDASSGAVVIGNSIGISSIVRTVTGKYTVNLSTPYPNANYCVVGRASSPGEGNGHELYVGNKTASSFNLITCGDSVNSYPTYDPPDVAIAIFGAKS